MKISVFGLGYVGCVTGACLAKAGHSVIGVDVNPAKVDLINRGECPIVEPGLPELVAAMTTPGENNERRFRATADAASAIAETDVTMVCVGTPSDDSGAVNLDAVRATVQSIAGIVQSSERYHVVVIRSTVPPGTTASLIKLEKEFAAAVEGGRLGFVMNPEFLREGSSIEDFLEPPVTVIGQHDAKAGDVVESLYEFVDAPVVRMTLSAAEMIKYTNNAFHALKVTFANEIGTVCKALEIDSHEVMRVVCMDQKLNISNKYLTPGFAFGGSCLPKDLRALNHISRHKDLVMPLLDSMLQSNYQLIERTAQRVRNLGRRRVGMLGLSFKRDTDDLRESPYVALAESLIGKGFDLKAFDKNVSLSKLIGSNELFIKQHMPHIDRVFEDDCDAVIAHSETLIICNYEPMYEDSLRRLREDVSVIDLARIPDGLVAKSQSDGLAW